MYHTSKFFALARTMEYFKIPNDVLVICLANQLMRGVV